ncbi:cytochrome oxidase complex assembly protein 1-domain-containing protein [Truncatella angustata]|uniref:Cytochrome oxidase complex assembly protein 1-domain-containing protein n=1 Tax=Truncatella angustata TaxID=152316 RepID=A0A9P8UCH0_9PEZI|nr:cytochrome oxidase complex assembly protein 1-domain-containing protein [Truncatella angustata]KAH6645787.1 cytochrome oxidase complex assembly protein 1-domain-containing protein [Truncatella angustata]KAH8197633.1 hypothetical protein TruAng_008217 [Truncatella angustata]
MFSRALRRRALPSLRALESRISTPIQRRTLVRAPKPGDGPLMERRPDRELPSVESVSFRWMRTFPIFVFLITLSSLAIFNYQKLSSPTVSSTLYALRTSRKAREYLGDEIYFAQQIPWISGTMNQLRGVIDISFRVKGNRNEGVMRFVSFRPGPKAMFETTEWSLETKDGQTIDLLDAEAGDPFKALEGSAFLDEDEVQQNGRGFRTELK